MDIATGLGLFGGVVVVSTLILLGGDFRMFVSDHAMIVIFGVTFWSFCAAGAVDNALYYWNGETNTYPSGTYTEPSYANYHTNTYWTSSDHNRSYMMYIADKVWVPGWGTPGMVTFGSYPSAGAGINDAVLNV